MEEDSFCFNSFFFQSDNNDSETFPLNLELTDYKYIHVLPGDSQIWLYWRKICALFSLCNPNFEVAASEFLLTRSGKEPDI